MNRFKDEQGRTWLCTPNMAKHLGITPGALANYKYDGTLKRGDHWVQQTTGHKRVFYNKDVVTKWWRGSTSPRPNSESENLNGTATLPQKANRIVSIYLQEHLYEKLVQIQSETSVTIKKEIDGIVLQATEEKPKLGTVVNMLLTKSITDHFDRQSA